MSNTGTKRRTRKRMTRKNTKWTVPEIQAVALEYTNVADFRNGNPKAYSAAHRHDVFEAVTAHMTGTQQSWDNAKAAEVAKLYKTRGDFSLGAPGAYTYARRANILEDICAHMPANIAKAKAKWTPDTLKAEAAKYDSMTEFRKANRSAYVTASRLKILDELYVDA